MPMNIEQQRMKHAWETIEQIKKVPSAKDEKRWIYRLPMFIINSGLGQALAFLNAKAKDSIAGKRISEWVAKRIPEKGASSQLLKRIVEDESDSPDFLRRATAETLEYIQWLKRFAEAEIEE